MRCHYEVLNVSKEADEAEIKTSYKKLALRWHPDKNLDDAGNAKEQFQLVQQAYEVLSDKQERAWYDRHREQILRGANSDLADQQLDVFQYFTTSCFKGYGDDDNGFYTVYRTVFEQIAKEDLDYYENKEEFVNIPTFGTSESDYDSIVNPFYAHWMSYSTKKSYVWLDPYSINDVRDRRYLKAVEKENKKVRSKAKKERNEEIRNLVAFVRKRDKRVQAWNKQNEAKLKSNRKKLDELRRQKLEENRKLNESQVQAEWTKFENMTSQLQEIENDLNREFGNSDVSDEEEYSELYCAACNKLFKTEKSFQNHESSKKHRENVLLLRAQLLEDENSSEIDEKISEEDNVADLESELSSGKRPTNPEDEESDASEEEINVDIPRRKKTQKTKSFSSHHHISPDTDSEDIPHILHKKPNKTKKNKSVHKVDSSDDDFKMTSTFPASTSSDDFSSSKKGKKKNRKNKTKKPQPEDNSNVTLPQDNETVKTENTLQDISKEEPVTHVCSTCSKTYPSKNKLFQHLKAEGHGAPLPSNIIGVSAKVKGKNRSSKK